MDIKTGKSSVYASLITPAGEVTGFCKIFEPSTKFDKEGIYSINILLSKEDGEMLLEKVKEVRAAQADNFRKNKEKIQPVTSLAPYAEEDEETGEAIPDEEGRYILKAKAKAGIKDSKVFNHIGVFDAKGRPVKAVNMGAGSKVKLKIDLVGYTVGGKIGVSIKLLAVQILKLTEYESSKGGSFDGFSVEDGYEYEEKEELIQEDTDEEEAF